MIFSPVMLLPDPGSSGSLKLNFFFCLIYTWLAASQARIITLGETVQFGIHQIIFSSHGKVLSYFFGKQQDAF